MRILFNIDGNQALSEVSHMEFVDSLTAIFHPYDGLFDIQVTFPGSWEAQTAVENLFTQGYANLSPCKAEYLPAEEAMPELEEAAAALCQCPNCGMEFPLNQEDIDRGTCCCPHCNAELTFVNEESPKYNPYNLQ